MTKKLKYDIDRTTRFKRQTKKMARRGYRIELLEEIILTLASGEPIAAKNRNHPLTGNYSGFRECHITPDWLLNI